MTDSTRVFIQLNAYADVAAAEADQHTVKDLHSSEMVGRFETTVIARDDQGQVRVVEEEATARRWASRGLVVGAVLGVMFPPSILLAAGAGAVAGGFGAKDNGLLLKAIPDADLDALGRLINPGEAALVVVGEDSVRHSIELARLTPLRTSIQTGHGTYADLEAEVMTALNARADDTKST
jgi:uncharacterized membrane protein